MSLDLNSLLAPAGAPGWDTVLHLGAGDGRGWQRTAPGLARRVVLVEGDPATATRLAAAARRRPGWQVVAQVVGPADAEASWYEHDPSGFDGLVRQDQGAAAAQLPRLRCTGERRVAVRSLAGLLQELDCTGAPKGRAALLVDLPLCEGEWAPKAALAGFSTVIVTPAAGAGRETPAALSAGLVDAGFLRRTTRGAPRCAVFELDETLHATLRTERRRLGQEINRRERALEQLRTSRHELALELAASHERVRSLEGSLGRMRTLRDATEQRQLEVRQSLQRADAALRALSPLLGSPEDGGA